MKIAVLGTGNIGGTLGKKWGKAGHEIMFGSRDSHHPRVQELLQVIGHQAAAGTPAEAIAFGEVVLIAVPGNSVDELAAAQSASLDGKILLDATNRFGSATISSVAVLSQYAPRARVFRAFNSLGWEIFANPMFGETQADLFYCGPEGDARQVVESLIREVGLRPVRVGGLDRVQAVDAIGSLWVALVFGEGMPRHLAFKMLT
jgi:predicted dinucleotide-binding enzyme